MHKCFLELNPVPSERFAATFPDQRRHFIGREVCDGPFRNVSKNLETYSSPHLLSAHNQSDEHNAANGSLINLLTTCSKSFKDVSENFRNVLLASQLDISRRWHLLRDIIGVDLGSGSGDKDQDEDQDLSSGSGDKYQDQDHQDQDQDHQDHQDKDLSSSSRDKDQDQDNLCPR